jgi:hypothetical protein
VAKEVGMDSGDAQEEVGYPVKTVQIVDSKPISDKPEDEFASQNEGYQSECRE